jgi:hypothetical protein
MKQVFFLLIFFAINFSGSRGDVGLCVTCPDTIPDSIQMKQIIESVGDHIIDSFTNKLKEEVYITKQLQDSAAYIVDSVYNEKNKRKVVGRVDAWMMNMDEMVIYDWLYWIYPNGDIRYYDVKQR